MNGHGERAALIGYRYAKMTGTKATTMLLVLGFLLCCGERMPDELIASAGPLRWVVRLFCLGMVWAVLWANHQPTWQVWITGDSLRLECRDGQEMAISVWLVKRVTRYGRGCGVLPGYQLLFERGAPLWGVYLPLSDAATDLVQQLPEYKRWYAPTRAQATTEGTPDTALSRARPAVADADQAHALSPADPPDQLTESEDA